MRKGPDLPDTEPNRVQSWDGCLSGALSGEGEVSGGLRGCSLLHVGGMRLARFELVEEVFAYRLRVEVEQCPSRFEVLDEEPPQGVGQGDGCQWNRCHARQGSDDGHDFQGMENQVSTEVCARNTSEQR